MAAYNVLLNLGPINFFVLYGPRSSTKVSLGYGAWILFQIALYQFLPSKLSTGQLTPAGNLLKYRTNGLLAWIVTHVLFVALAVSGLMDPAILARHWEPLLVTTNIAGFLLTGLVYAKAHLSPTHEKDRKFSGSVLYDMYMGIELNPRFGKYFDFKLFTNGRPGIIAWTLIDFSFIAYQYEIHGYITKSILVSTILHTIYVVDFFINEDWYLRTIDICHDHFGFYLAWGSIVWLPGIYTLQTQYLARNPVIWSDAQAAGILLTGISGYILFRSVNHQKDIVRRTKGYCHLWGSPAKVLRVKYHTKDGLEHKSLLLCSGWWGLARHVNYLGDLILSYSMCAACGFTNLLPWTYAIFMTILLIHRCWRDEERCSKKYGKGWEEYCKRVPWVLIPGVY
ncbi:ERG4/ERG24 ergosterol biosynthesis protein [Hyaloscypha hepaticicola]|uniref:7-dehydrocholesterol reductase n=1 Tax=Hyaloscypha hepaticicola TaxID=2082293 RepID=A0A2J6QHQ7_9HELO|nr:ERG4/ERG24 ergosterol biosynthesis protein [Hyaloscypha hepaticicola]